MAERPLTREEYGEKLLELAKIAESLKSTEAQINTLQQKEATGGLSDAEKLQLDILKERRQNNLEYGAYIERLIYRVGYDSPFSRPN